MLEKIASALGRNDEKPNIELAKLLVNTKNSEGIAEIVTGLGMKSAIANDCIKVLYEIGEIDAGLVAPYVNSFIDLLKSKNNRLVWGAMTALAQIATLETKAIYSRFDEVYEAYKTGSVITVDNSISVFAKLCVDKECEKKIQPLLIEHLRTCRLKEIPQHLERMSICINSENATKFDEVCKDRINDLTAAQKTRVNKVMKLVRG